MMRLLTVLVLGFCLAACSSSTAPSTTTGVGISPVGISPPTLTVQTGQLVQFSVWGSNFPPVTLPSQGFAWSVAGTGCSGARCGTIDATGRYTAPATVPDPAIVTVTARSVVDPTKSLEATVTLSPLESFSINPTSVEFGKQLVRKQAATQLRHAGFQVRSDVGEDHWRKLTPLSCLTPAPATRPAAHRPIA